MRMFQSNNAHGFMLLQLMIGIVVIGIWSGIVALNLGSFLGRQAVDNGVGDITTLLDEARSRTLAREGGTQYGVHLEATKAVLFSGTTYSSTAPDNRTVILDRSTQITSIALSGGGSDVIFDPLSGDTDEDGSFVVGSVTTSAGAKTVTITHAGQASSH